MDPVKGSLGTHTRHRPHPRGGSCCRQRLKTPSQAGPDPGGISPGNRSFHTRWGPFMARKRFLTPSEAGPRSRHGAVPGSRDVVPTCQPWCRISSRERALSWPSRAHEDGPAGGTARECAAAVGKVGKDGTAAPLPARHWGMEAAPVFNQCQENSRSCARAGVEPWDKSGGLLRHHLPLDPQRSPGPEHTRSRPRSKGVGILG